MNDTDLLASLLSTNSTLPSKSQEFLIAEYSALRDEILKSTEIQHQTLSLALIATGTFLSIGLQFNSTTTMLIYPGLGMFLASAWIQKRRGIRKIGSYIRTYIESEFLPDSRGWEHFLTPTRTEPHWLVVASQGGVFIGTQLIAMFLPMLSIIKASLSQEDILLLTLDIFITIFTIYILYRK